jgi:hypothetical protein
MEEGRYKGRNKGGGRKVKRGREGKKGREGKGGREGRKATGSSFPTDFSKPAGNKGKKGGGNEGRNKGTKEHTGHVHRLQMVRESTPRASENRSSH